MRREPERGQREQQVPEARGDPVPGAHQQDQSGHDPHPVMRPGNRRHEQPGGSGHHGRAQPVLPPHQHDGHRQADDGERERDDDPPGADMTLPFGDPDRRPVGRLVADVGSADAPGVMGKVLPVQRRGPGRDSEPDKPADDKRAGRYERCLRPSGQQEEQDEDGRRQLDRRRYPHPDARVATSRDAPDIGEDQGQQDQVDLAEEQRLVHRIKRHRGRDQARDHQPRRPVAGQLEDDDAGIDERRDRDQVPSHPRHGERERRERHEHDGRERRIGKPVTVGQRQVEAVVVQDGVAAPHVNAEIQGVIRGGECDDHRELEAEHAVYDRSNPSPPGRRLLVR